MCWTSWHVRAVTKLKNNRSGFTLPKMSAVPNRDPKIRPTRLNPWIATLLALLAVLGVYFLWFRARPHSVVPDVLRVDELSLVHGRLCPNGSTNWFSGKMVEYYPNGQLKSRTDVSNGWLQGFSIGWYTNGQMQVREPFSTSMANGVRTKWHENGQKQSEAPIRMGELDGTFQRWDDQGRLLEELEMKAGKPQGRSRSFHPDGSVKSAAMMSNGAVLWRTNYPPGQVQEKRR